MKFLFDSEYKRVKNWKFYIKVDKGYYVTNDESLYEHYRKLLEWLV